MTKEYEPFGKVCVRLGFCSMQDVERALERQREIEVRDKKRILLGIIMLEEGIIDNEQLIRVLRYYEKHPPK